jgi:hypothetical protein
MLAVGLGLGIAAVRVHRTGARLRWDARLPGLALLAFWSISYATWALAFGVQRYAVLLEVLALPVIVIGFSLALPRLATRRVSVLMLLLLAAFLAVTTKPVDFGRRSMGWAPLVPAETIQTLTRYDAVVIASPPLAYLRAVTRNAPGSSSQTWLGMPFNEADRVAAEQVLRGKSVGMVFYPDDHDSAEAAASTLGFRLTDECMLFDSPLSNSLGLRSVELCSAVQLP